MPIKGDVLISRHDTHVADVLRNSLGRLSRYPQRWVSVLGVSDAR
jgi:hypothetical protein